MCLKVCIYDPDAISQEVMGRMIQLIRVRRGTSTVRQEKLQELRQGRY